MNAPIKLFALVLACSLLAGRAPAANAASPRAAELGIDEIRSVVMASQDRVRNLRAVFRVRGHGRTTRRELRQILAAKGAARYLRARRYLDDEWTRDFDDHDSFYDGARFDVFYPVLRCYETTRKFAVHPYTEKTRGHGFWDALGWWPPDDASAPPTIDGRTYFIRHILADARCRVAANQELVDGRWRHVVEIAGEHRLWIDAASGAVPRRECFVGPHHTLLSRCEQEDYREVAPGVMLPFRLTRVIPAASMHGIFTVDEYQVNDVSDAIFRFQPPPGTLVTDRDADTAHQIPGGLECLDEICERAALIAGGPRGSTMGRRPFGSLELWSFLGAASVCVALVVARRIVRRWHRRFTKAGSFAGGSNHVGS